VGAHRVLIAFDCKRHTRKVGLSYVSAFADQATDVGASLAVLVSSAGFTKGAREIAKTHSVTLQTLRQAETADWMRLVGPDSWTSILGVTAREVEVSLGMRSGQELAGSMETPLLDANHVPFETVGELFWREWNTLATTRQVGRGTIEVIAAPRQVLVECDGRFEEVKRIRVSVELVATRWIVHLELSNGHVLQSESGELAYQEFTSSSFDWQQVMESQPGHELSVEEFALLVSKGQMTVDLADVNRFVRLRLQLKSDPDRKPESS
jgi:hypothetical protein